VVLITSVDSVDTDVDAAVVPSLACASSEGVRGPSWTSRYVALLAGLDLVATFVATMICWVVGSADDRQAVTVFSGHVHYWSLAVAAPLIWLAALAGSGAYSRHDASQGFDDYRLPARVGIYGAGFISILAFALNVGLSQLIVLVYFPVLVGTSLLLRCIFRQGLFALHRRGRALRRMLLVGDKTCVTRFANHIFRQPMPGYRLVGACIPSDESVIGHGRSRVSVVGRPEDLVALAEVGDVDTVLIVGHPKFEGTTLQEVAWRLERSGRNLLIGPDVVDLAGPRISIAPIGGLPLLRIGDPLIGVHRHTVKAWVERFLALLLLALMAPFLGLIAVAIIADTGAPVFYRQQRVGFKGRLFTIIKFRTMEPGADAKLDELRNNNDHDGALFKMRQDPRVTRLGRWLRRYSLDELPQLYNVIRGDMVLIGPRPCLPSETVNFDEAAQRRFLARPGLTGLWQVSGRADLSWEEAVRLDLYYVENWSPWMDIVIAWRTLGVAMTGSGGY
jgi:exopolysaccharide biosynthesis polyprenyl glycosylphosphotransferase